MRWLFLVLLLVATPAIAATDEQCLQYALYKEARGERLKTQRAVLDVINHRMQESGESACAVLRKPSQFPYFKKGVKRVDFSFTLRYNIVSGMEPVLKDERYLFFNHHRHPWGVSTIKIGRLYFSR